MKSLVKFFALSRLNLSPFLRACKCVQTYLISHGETTSMFSELHGGVCSWLPEVPYFVSRSGGLLE